MENYTKARIVEQPSVCPFTERFTNTPEVRVKDGSKIRNLLRFALSRLDASPRKAEEELEGQPTADQGSQAARQEAVRQLPCRQIVFTATGKGASKAITCAEIVKRRVKGLHQLTKLTYSTVLEVWEPLEPSAGLDSLTVSRNLPTIWILLSSEPLDCNQPGYQAPGRYDALWAASANREEGGGSTEPRVRHQRKRGGGGRGKGPGRQTGRSRETTKGHS